MHRGEGERSAKREMHRGEGERSAKREICIEGKRRDPLRERYA